MQKMPRLQEGRLRALERLAKWPPQRRVGVADVMKATGFGLRWSYVLTERVRARQRYLAGGLPPKSKVFYARPRLVSEEINQVLPEVFEAVRWAKGVRLRQKLGWSTGHLKAPAPAPTFGEMENIASRLGIKSSKTTLRRALRRLGLRTSAGKLCDEVAVDMVWQKNGARWPRQVCEPCNADEGPSAEPVDRRPCRPS